MEIVKFDQTKAELQEIVESTKNITATDLKDKAQLAVVKENRTLLRKIEIEIEKQGKAMRDEANKYAKLVIADEKGLKAITSPEIARLKSIEEEAEKLEVREDRMRGLPQRKKKLEFIGDKVEISDEELLEMNYEQFTAYHNQRVADKLESDREALEADKRKVEQEKNRLKIEAEAKEKAEKDLEAEIARKSKAEADREAREKAQLEANKKYQSWLEDNGYNETEYIVKDTGDKFVLYKKISELTK